MTFDPSNALRIGQGFFPPNLVVIGHFWAVWPLVDPGWPMHDLWPQQCITPWLGLLPIKFGSHWVFLRQLDLWMTFDLWWGHFQNMLLSLRGLFPIPMPNFSPISRSMTKRIAGHTHILHYFSNIDFKSSASVYPDPSNMSAWSVGLGGWFCGLWVCYMLELVFYGYTVVGILLIYIFVQYCSMCYMCLSQWVGGVTPFGWQRFFASGSSRLIHLDTFL